ncbi:MAG: HNH endonuclease, partial [Betaproteobacteria bacterium]|nr:HNH endonuclease [Betaproteobacteria bacterium]
ERCGRNVPRKNHETVRHLQFEIELRQMNVLDGGELRKLENTEVAGAMEKLIFANKPSADEQTQNRAAIAGLPKTRKAKNESRGKKDILRDIACGAQNGRAGFCANHLREKLQLIENNKTESEEWARLHKERILAAADAPPSTRQKVWRVQKTVQLMLKKHGIAPEEITHVGLETARFDINSLAQEEGRKGKTARNYQTSRRPDNRRDLAEQQGGLCLICGELLGADIHADHFFPKSRGGAFARLNLVALHTACNINKNNNLISINALNEDAAAHLRANDPKKFRYLQKNMEDKDARQNLTKAPQHTMLGAKILREELRKTLGVGKEKTAEIFKRIRGQDAALLRERWFPHMHRQKRALREQLRNKGNQYFLAFTAGEKSVRKLPPNNHLFSAGEKLKIENAEADDWLKLENGASDLVGNPKGDEPARDIYITAQNGRAELELITDGDAPPPDLGKYKKTAVGKTVNIPLANIRPKEWEKFAARVAPSWLLLENGKLTGTIPPPENGKFVPKAARVEFYKDGELIGSVKIAVRTAQKIRVAVVPPKTDNIHSFHHALDAVVLAANVDWKKITRLGKDPRTRNLNQREAMEKEIQKAAPDFSAWELPALDGKPDGELCAPEKKADYFYEDREDRGRVSASKHDREPYGFAKFKGHLAGLRLGQV